MAKKDTTATPPSAKPPTEGDTTQGAKPAGKPGRPAGKPGRPAGFSTKDGDRFKANLPLPETKMAPQALAIAKIVEAAGTEGITRSDLVRQMEGVVVTRQPQGRILSYYQKALLDSGFFTLTPQPVEPVKNEAAVNAEAPTA